RERVPPSVHLITLENASDRDRVAAALAELPALHAEVLVRWHVERQHEPAGGDQHPGPDDRVEREVVLANEVVVANVAGGRRPPTRGAGLGRASEPRPFLRGAQVPDDRVVPDVDPLAVVAGHRDRHTPRDVARDWTAVELPLLELRPREVEDVRSPMRLV